MLDLKSIKVISMVKLLRDNLGGKWKYRPGGIWECNDGERTVRRNCMCDHDGDCNCIPTYHLYGKDSTKALLFWEDKIEVIGEKKNG